MVYLDNPGSIVFDIQDVPALARLLQGTRDADRRRQHLGLPRPLSAADARRRHLDRRRHQVHRRPFRPRHGLGIGERALRRPDLARRQDARPDRQPRRGLQRAEGPAHGRSPPRHASSPHRRGDRLARAAAAGASASCARPSPSDPGHALWKRDFKGANGLFSIELAPPFVQADADRFVDASGCSASAPPGAATEPRPDLSQDPRLERRQRSCASTSASRTPPTSSPTSPGGSRRWPDQARRGGVSQGGKPSDERSIVRRRPVIRLSSPALARGCGQRLVITISRYSLGTTMVPSSARFILPISASRSFLSPRWFASSSAAKALSIGP